MLTNDRKLETSWTRISFCSSRCSSRSRSSRASGRVSGAGRSTLAGSFEAVVRRSALVSTDPRFPRLRDASAQTDSAPASDVVALSDTERARPDRQYPRIAFDAIDRRCRAGLRELAAWTSFSDEDAEEVVQETLLDLFVGSESSGDAPEDIIDKLAADRVVSFNRSAQRRARLCSALARVDTETRAERNGQGALWLGGGSSTRRRSPEDC
jgi:hypothetical protein